MEPASGRGGPIKALRLAALSFDVRVDQLTVRGLGCREPILIRAGWRRRAARPLPHAANAADAVAALAVTQQSLPV